MALALAHSADGWTARFGNSAKPAAVAIGNFDGVHLGHQKILSGVLRRAHREEMLAAVLTFYPHPARVLRPADAPALLMTLEQRLATIEAMGMDAVLVMRFDEELAKVSPEDFVRRILRDTMHAGAVLVGGNFRFGHRQAGDVKLLSELGRQLGLEVEIVPPVVADGIVVSSTAIRNALREGRVDDARRMLGRPFALEGEIRPGTGQGRKLVVPTLNLGTDQELLPKNGVYATEAVIDGNIYRAATNVGLRPTFDGARITIESHLFDFSESLASGRMDVRFFARLRDERKFSGPEALREQVLKDLKHAQAHFRDSKVEPQHLKKKET
jgi:riboflavin kinase/FMN adenylyltransferase